MAEKINNDLLKKFVNNQCSPKEMEELIAYFQRLDTADGMPDFEEVLKLKSNSHVVSPEQFSKKLTNIFSKMKEEESRVRTILLWRCSAVAAMLAIAFGIGFNFWKIDTAVVFIPPKDAITLEMEDGRKEIIEEGKTFDIKNSLGTIVGKQQGNTLIYKGKKSRELVYNTLTVPYGKRFSLKLSDGTTVELNAGSSLKYPVSFNSTATREVELNGEAFFSVSKNSQQAFKVITSELSVRVLGTRFNVSSYPEDPTVAVVLIEGSVSLHPKIKEAPENPTLLTPGLKGTLTKDRGEIKTEPVVTDRYTSWRDGELVFRNMSFENILKKLERHYNITIENNNEALANTLFNASFGQESLKKVLENLHTVYGFEYSIYENHITIK